MSIAGTTPVTAAIAPSSASDAYATHIAEYGKGGYQVVADNTARDNITAARRTYGMRVYVITTGITYVLGPGLGNGDWSVDNRGQQVVDSWAALAALNGSTIPNGTEFYVRCGATLGDGGEGDFWFDNTATTTVITGMVIAPASGTGRFFRKYDGVVNARWFGAKGDFNTDDTAALQAALAFASKPTYGWANTAGQNYSALELYVPTGSYKVTGTLKNYGVRFFGKSAHHSGNYNSDTLFFSQHSGHFMTFDYGGTDGPLGVADYRLGSIEDVNIEGYPETYPGTKISITAVTDRLEFFVAPASVPTLDTGAPQMNVAFFYDNQGRWLGSGQISAADGGTGKITLVSGTDVYATVSGSVLRTSDKVVFTPIIAAETTLTNFADPASSGPCGVFMKCSYNGSGHGPTVRNVLISNFHVGIRVGPGLLERRVSDIRIQQCKYAGILYPREWYSTDSPYTGFIYITCKYRSDYNSSFTNSITNQQLCNTTVGWYGFGPLDRADLVLIEMASWAQMIVQRGLNQQINYLYCDLCIRHGLVLQRGYQGDTSGATYDNTLRINSIVLRTPLSGAGASFALDSVHSDRYAVSLPNSNSATPSLLSIGSLSINDGGLGDFSHGFNIISASGNKVTIDQVTCRWAAGTWYTGQPPFISGIARNLTASETYTGIAETATDELTIANKGQSTGKWQDSGLTLSPLTGITPLKMIRNDTGKTVSFVIGTDTLLARNESQSVYFNTASADATFASFTIGHNGMPSAPKLCILNAEWANSSAGTDVAASDFYIIASRGTGANATGGRILFQTPATTASGTTAQTATTRLTLRREGQLGYIQLASDPTSAVNGDLYSNSTNSKFRALLNSKWGNLDRWTVRADTGTTVTVNAHDELVTLSNAGAITVNLPAGILNQRYAFKNIGAGTATLTPNGSEKLFTTAQVSTLALATGDYKLIQWDGTQWLVLG